MKKNIQSCFKKYVPLYCLRTFAKLMNRVSRAKGNFFFSLLLLKKFLNTVISTDVDKKTFASRRLFDYISGRLVVLHRRTHAILPSKRQNRPIVDRTFLSHLIIPFGARRFLKTLSTTSLNKCLCLFVMLSSLGAWSPVLAESHPLAYQDQKSFYLVRGKRGFSDFQTRPLILSSDVLVFISFSMPEPLIKSVLKQAKSYGISVVLKGVVDGNLNRTLQKIFQLNQSIKASILIDPRWFRRFQIDNVPALVVFKHKSNQWMKQATPQTLPPYDVIFGAISIRSALEEIAVHGDAGQVVAQALLKKGASKS